MKKFTIFISDLHLHQATPKKVDDFIKLLRNDALNAEALYILGDFFHAWIGDDDRNDFNIKIENALKEYTLHKPVFLMSGNHDFLLGKKFMERTGCTQIQDPTVINLYGIPTLLSHGDILCVNNDIIHKLLRKFIYNAKYRQMFLLLPLFMRTFVANFLIKMSAKKEQKKLELAKSISSSMVIELMLKYNVKQFIHGHMHKYDVQEFLLNGSVAKRITLGDWENGASSLIYYQNGSKFFTK